MLQPGERVVVAVSGGADSLALLHALSELQREYKLSFVVAHVDHGLRPEGPREMKFVRLAAKRLGLTFEGKKIDAAAGKRDRGLNLQESAREARYEFLTKLAAKRRAAKIALGHTADDQAESVVMRILRGAGTRGLAGIPPVRDGLLIRPLIRTWRSDIESFLAEREIPYVSDASNLSRKYLRNRIRLELIPILKEYNPRIRECLAEMADMSLIVTIVRKGWGDTVLESSMKAGASGGTIMFGRGLGVNETQKILGIQIEPEKEIVLSVVQRSEATAILHEIVRVTDLEKPGTGIAFVIPVQDVVGVAEAATQGL